MDTKTNYSKKFLNALASETRKIIPEEIPIKKVFTEQKKYKDKIKSKIKGEEDKEEFPFVLIRPLDIKQKWKDGKVIKLQQFLIRIGIENDVSPEEGYFEVSEMADNIIKHYTDKPLATVERDGYSYHVNLGEEIVGYLNDELTANEYWTYDVLISLDIPSIRN